MNETEKRADDLTAEFRSWYDVNGPTSILFVHYCGPEFIRTFGADLAKALQHIHGLICEGFRMRWVMHNAVAAIAVWEGLDEPPEWEKVFNRENLWPLPWDDK